MVSGDLHGTDSKAPVELDFMFPSGTVALSSAGPILRVWDMVAGVSTTTVTLPTPSPATMSGFSYFSPQSF